MDKHGNVQYSKDSINKETGKITKRGTIKRKKITKHPHPSVIMNKRKLIKELRDGKIKLKPDAVKLLFKQGLSKDTIAKELEVSENYVNQILRGYVG